MDIIDFKILHEKFLMHRYQIILDEKVYSFIKEDFKCLYKLVKEVMKKYQ